MCEYVCAISVTVCVCVTNTAILYSRWGGGESIVCVREKVCVSLCVCVCICACLHTDWQPAKKMLEQYKSSLPKEQGDDPETTAHILAVMDDDNVYGENFFLCKVYNI